MTETEARTLAHLAIQKMPLALQERHNKVWADLEVKLTARAGKGAKSYEVHHLVATARSQYHEMLAGFHAPDHCKAAIVSRFGL